jgi:hypothetical protein
MSTPTYTLFASKNNGHWTNECCASVPVVMLLSGIRNHSLSLHPKNIAPN